MTQRDTLLKSRYRKTPALDDATIHSSMLNAIIDQRLPPGTRLIEAELCDIYGTSRRNIERVLVRLETEGVVTIERNRGARIAQPTPRDAANIFALRKLVESEVIRLLSGKISEPPESRIRAALLEEQKAPSDQNDRMHIHHSGEFHVILAEECGNAEITSLIRRLVARTSLVTQLFGNDRALECWHEEHLLLVDLLVSGATEKASDLMLAHLNSIEGELRLSEPKEAELDLRNALLRTK